jgi:LysM repeat protein
VNLSSLKARIKDSINQGADKFISAKVRDELGLNRPSLELLQSLSDSHEDESHLNTFFKPVNSNFHSAKNYKNIQKWVVGIIVILTLALVFLFFTMIIPHNSYNNSLGDSQIIVNGKTIKEADESSDKAFSPASKIHEPNVNDRVVSEEVKVENLKLSDPIIEKTQEIKKETENFKQTAKTPTSSQHIVKRGDTLEIIAIKYYGSAGYQNIDKIKRANQIRNSRLINIGQKLVIPI